MLGVWSVLDESRDRVGARLILSLAERLASQEKRVLVFELCPQRPTLDILFGMDEKVVYTLADVGEVKPDRVLLSARKNIFFVPSITDLACKDTLGDAIGACIAEVKPDVALILFERAVYEPVRAISDGVLLLTDPSAASLRASTAFAEKFPVTGWLLSDFTSVRQSLSARALSDMLCAPLIGILPRLDGDNTYCIARKDFLFAVRNIAARLSGQNVPLLCGLSGKRSYNKAFLEG